MELCSKRQTGAQNPQRFCSGLFQQYCPSNNFFNIKDTP